MMNKNDIKEMEKKLIDAKNDLITKTTKTKEREDEYLNNTVGDDVDKACDSFEREILFELTDNERVKLDDINNALEKIKQGKYGICEKCKKPIDLKRLKLKSYARFCIECQSEMEKTQP